jgi:hypothetical protein
MNWHLGLDTRITLLAAGPIFLLALVLGVWKYRQIMVADDHRAHPYVDIAHRAAGVYFRDACAIASRKAVAAILAPTALRWSPTSEAYPSYSAKYP